MVVEAPPATAHPAAAGGPPPEARQCDDCLRVFLSSSLSEVAAERAALDELLESSDLPLRVWRYEEDTAASSRSHMDVWRDRIERCELYIGIFWKKLGKYTVDELNWARRHGKNLLLFAKTVDERDRSPELAQFIEKADDPESGLAFALFKTPEQFAVKAHRSLTLELLHGWRQAARLADERTTTGPAGFALTDTPVGWEASDPVAEPVEQPVPGPERRSVRPLPALDKPQQRPVGADQDPDSPGALSRVQQAICTGARIVGVTGDPGAGKSTLLRRVAHAGLGLMCPAPEGGERFPDGEGLAPDVAKGDGFGDVVQGIWELFYRREGEASGPATPRALNDLNGDPADGRTGKHALVVVPNGAVDPDVLAQVAAALPHLTFVVEGTVSRGGEAGVETAEVEVSLLTDLGDALGVFRQALATGTQHVTEVGDMLKQLGLLEEGLPAAHVVQLANRARDVLEDVLDDPVGALASWARRIVKRFMSDRATALYDVLVPEGTDRMLARACGAIGVPVPRDVLVGLVESESAVDGAVWRGVLVPGSPRLTLAPGLRDMVANELAEAQLRPEILDNALDWVAGAGPDDVFQDRAFVREMMVWAKESGRWRDVVTLGQSLERVLALTSRWDGWDAVLEDVADAARMTGDTSALAWARHQCGSKALAEGDYHRARADLRAALALRRRLGETEAARVTRHNLGLVPSAMKWPRRIFAWLLAALAAMLLALAPAAGAGDGGGNGDGDGADGGGVVPPVVPVSPATLEVHKTVDADGDGTFGHPLADAVIAPPGGVPTFRVEVVPPPADTVVLTSIVDDVFGDLTALAGSTCATGATLAPDGDPYVCTFAAPVQGAAGDVHADTVTVRAEGGIAYEGAGRLSIGFGEPVPPGVPPPGPPVNLAAAFAERRVPEGESRVRPVTVEAFFDADHWPVTVVTARDDELGGLEDVPGSSCQVPQARERGERYLCQYPVVVGGNAGATVKRLVSVTVVDAEGNIGGGQDTVPVTFTDVAPRLEARLDGPAQAVAGTTVELELIVHNRSVIEDPVTIGAPVDGGGGALVGCAEFAVLSPDPAAAPYTCTFSVPVTGATGSTLEVTAGVVGADDEGTPARASATRTIEVVGTGVTVRVDATPDSGLSFPFEAPVGGTVAEGGPRTVALAPGSHVIAQGAVPVGWALDGIDCGAGAVADVAAGRATVTVSAGQVVECTFAYSTSGGQSQTTRKLDLTPEILLFGSAGSEQVAVRNVGSEAFTVTIGAPPAPFSTSGCAGVQLAPGESCTFTVAYAGGPGLADLAVGVSVGGARVDAQGDTVLLLFGR